MADRRVHGTARSSSPLAKIALPRLPISSQRQDTGAITKSKVAIACELCRRKRARCDGGRPACRRCVEEGEECKYAVRRRERLLEIQQELEEASVTARSLLAKVMGQVDAATQKEIHSLLSKPLPPTEWRGKQDSILDKSRDAAPPLSAGSDPDTMNYEMSRPDPDAQRDVLHGIMNTIRYCHPSQVDALVHMIRSNSSPEEIANFISTRMNADFEVSSLIAAQQQNVMSVHNLCDQPLFKLQAKPWTTVTEDDELVSHLISLYFSWDQIFTCIDRVPFLEDMVTGRSDFCSPFLVNAVLALSCHYSTRLEHRSEPWSERNLGSQFLAEAKRLWDVEEGAIKLTNVQACMLMAICNNVDGKDRMGTIYARLAGQMAQDLGLFAERTRTPPIDDRAAKMQRARTFTAWGVFSFTTCMAFYLHTEPAISEQPQNPFEIVESFYSPDEVWTPYPWVRSPRPSYMGAHFKALFAFSCIVHRIAKLIFKPGAVVTEAIIMDQVRSLKKWEEELPPVLADWKVNDSAHNLLLHMYLCSVTIHICETLKSEQRSSVDPSSPSADSPSTSSEQSPSPGPSAMSPSPVMSIPSLKSSAYSGIRNIIMAYNSQYMWSVGTPITVQFLGHYAFNSLPPPPHLTPEGFVFSTEARTSLYITLEGLLQHCHSTLLAKIIFKTIQANIEKFSVQLPEESASVLARFKTLWTSRDAEAIRSEWPIEVQEQVEPDETQSLEPSGSASVGGQEEEMKSPSSMSQQQAGPTSSVQEFNDETVARRRELLKQGWVTMIQESREQTQQQASP